VTKSLYQKQQNITPCKFLHYTCTLKSIGFQ